MKNKTHAAFIVLAIAFFLFSKSALAQAAFQATIVSNFSGFNLGNMYELDNGQLWKQTEAWIWYWYWSMPQAVFYHENGSWKMKVENIEHPVTVARIK